MKVKPAIGADGVQLLVRGPDGRRINPEGENVPDIQFWFRAVVHGDVVEMPPDEPPAEPAPA